MISLCTFVKNEEACIQQMIRSVIDEVDEIILVDTGCTDLTLLRVKEIVDYYNSFSPEYPFIELKIHKMEFTNFGDIRTKTAHLATRPWILMLDADEELSYPQMLKQVVNQGSDAYAFPRRRWLDLEKKQQTELEAYPDWQVRFFKNNKSFVWKRELHEYFHGAAVHHLSMGPIIEHFHDVYKSTERLIERERLYKSLAKQAGVTVEGGHEI